MVVPNCASSTGVGQAATQSSGFTHEPVGPKFRSRNGRVKGRQLITWTRPRMYEKLLLTVIYELGSEGSKIPWEKIAHRLSPGASPSAIKQRMEKLRLELLQEGHLVPPPASFGPGITHDNSIRGYLKNPDGSQRPVPFDEACEHPKKSKFIPTMGSQPGRKTALAASRNDKLDSDEMEEVEDEKDLHLSDEVHNSSLHSVTAKRRASFVQESESYKKLATYKDTCVVPEPDTVANPEYTVSKPDVENAHNSFSSSCASKMSGQGRPKRKAAQRADILNSRLIDKTAAAVSVPTGAMVQGRISDPDEEIALDPANDCFFMEDDSIKKLGNQFDSASPSAVESVREYSKKPHAGVQAMTMGSSFFFRVAD